MNQFANGNQAAHREVPVQPLQEAFRRSGLTAAELARRLGWYRPDSVRVARQLGLISNGGRGHGSRPDMRKTMSRAKALEILDALGLDPVDVDIDV